MPVKLLSDVYQVLYGGDINVVNGREVHDDSLKSWQMGSRSFGLATLGSRIVPWPVAGTLIRILVSATSLVQDMSDEVIKVAIAVRIVESFRELVDEDARKSMLNLDIRIRTIFVADWKENIAAA